MYMCIDYRHIFCEGLVKNCVLQSKNPFHFETVFRHRADFFGRPAQKTVTEIKNNIQYFLVNISSPYIN